MRFVIVKAEFRTSKTCWYVNEKKQAVILLIFDAKGDEEAP